MKAVQYREIGKGPEVVEIDKPTPGPGEVLLRITAAGLCHSDEFIMSLPAEHFDVFRQAFDREGVVAELGPGVTGVEIGESVVVYGCWGCGVCEMCADGSEQLCLRGMTSPGLGQPGAMAEYMIVDDVRHLVPIGDLDPVKAASLTDAALTPYSALAKVRHLTGAATTTVIIGAGGLGHVAIKLLRELTATRVIALDIGQERLDFAKECGAHEVLESDAEAAGKIRELTGGRGAHAILDFVGNDITGQLAVEAVSVGGAIVLAGAGGGGAKNGFATAPYDLTVSNSLWGRRSELIKLVEMAKRGQVDITTQTFSIDEAPHAYELLHEAKILGRAVIVP